MPVVEHRTRAMASEVHVVAVDPAGDVGGAVDQRLGELEARWSRFRDTSDVSRLNRAGGRAVAVHEDTITLLVTMVEAWRLTGGRYDPTVLPILLRELPAGTGRPPLEWRTDGLRSLEVGEGWARLPAGVVLDPGGIGKGLAADLVASELLAAGTAGVLVGVGGDLAAAGRAPSPDGWPIVVERPDDPSRPLASFATAGGGVATSSPRRRPDLGGTEPHVADPRTARLVSTDLLAVTVVASCGWRAEAHATAALLGGSDRFVDELRRHDCLGVAVTTSGSVLATEELREALDPMAVGR